MRLYLILILLWILFREMCLVTVPNRKILNLDFFPEKVLGEGPKMAYILVLSSILNILYSP